MDSVNKRKLDTWEDEWEREAINTRQTPPNKTALYSSVLEQSYSKLKQTCTDLEMTLTSLTNSLETLKLSLDTQQAKTKQRQKKHRQLLIASIDRVTDRFVQNQKGCLGQLHENQRDLNQVLETGDALATALNLQLKAIQHGPHSSIINVNSQESTINVSREKDVDKNHLEDVANIEQLVIAHDALEKRYVQARSQKKGYQARVEVLEKELRRMNSLPQIIPILKSTTANCEMEIRQHRQAQTKLQIPSHIHQLGGLRIRSPLMASQQRKVNQQLYQTNLQLKKIYHSILRQRSTQQLMIYSYQVERKYLLSYYHALLAYQLDLQKEQKNQDRSVQFRHQYDEDPVMLEIKKCLTTFQQQQHRYNMVMLDPKKNYMDATNDQIIQAIEDVVAYEKKWHTKWSEDTNDNLDAIRLIDQSKHELAKSLFGEATSREKLELKPKTYDELQWILESTIHDLEDETNQLEDQYHDQDQEFQRRRSFVSLFFTDPFSFESKMEDYIDSLESNRTTPFSHNTTFGSIS
ncbi:uncharacterized protein BX664DRAFT_320486 [Halteromyces radiatus]|uniref:uncharacterized protein n=1 Tax=Halteromyces radiatus TaxID=101107 RepID=UPI002220A2FC|nr:uncharacterized protein BX664DRAFT_320486 [Halteromyces radiatus]KAI8099134.1 hypothetical protein BX664DRAFT_320486 [Halteromyces radiatus]